MEKQRITYIDLFRAAGIVSMIMGHINFGEPFDHLIHGFHMPLFFLVSGYFFKRSESTNSFKKKIRSKCKSLLLPYVIFAFFHIALASVLRKDFDYDWLRLLVFNTDKHGLPHAGALWFLTSLFFADIFYMTIDRICCYGKGMHCIVIAAGLIGNVLGLLPFRVPFGIDVSLVGMLFMHIGRLLRQDKTKKVLELNLISSLVLLVVGVSLIMINRYVNLRCGRYGIVPVFWTASIVTLIGLWNLCKIIDELANKANVCCYTYILNIGKDSIVYLCLNQLAIFASFKIVSHLNLSIWPARICVLISVLILLEGARKLLTGTKLKALIGQ